MASFRASKRTSQGGFGGSQGSKGWQPKELTPPGTWLEPTVMQLFPNGWRSEDSPCYLMVGNWVDGTNSDFITKFNIRLVIRAAGKQPNDDPAKPPAYGINGLTTQPPETMDCPVNNMSMLRERWHPICLRCIEVWQATQHGDPPNMVLVHCNEGINRAPALASILAGKLMDRKPLEMAKKLAKHRRINPMFTHGKEHACRLGLPTYEHVEEISRTEPFHVDYRESRFALVQEGSTWECVSPGDIQAKFEGHRPERPQRLANRTRQPLLKLRSPMHDTFDDDVHETQEVVKEVVNPPMSVRMRAFLKKYMDNKFDFDKDGQHCIHKLCELMKTNDFIYSD